MNEFTINRSKDECAKILSDQVINHLKYTVGVDFGDHKSEGFAREIIYNSISDMLRIMEKQERKRY